MTEIQLKSRHNKSAISPGKNRLYAAINNNTNNSCFDCGKKYPEYISINNGIFICKICAEYHLLYLKSQSRIIINDLSVLNNNELKYLYYGGNYKLKEFIKKEYPLLLKLSSNQIYMTLALDYYRKKLKYLIEGGKEPDKPLKSLGLLNINSNVKLSLNKNNIEINYINENNFFTTLKTDSSKEFNIKNNYINYKNLTFNPNYYISSSPNLNSNIYIRNLKKKNNSEYKNDDDNMDNYYKLIDDIKKDSKKKDYNKKSILNRFNKKLRKSKSGNISIKSGKLLKKIYILNYKTLSESRKKKRLKKSLKGVYSKPRLISKLIMRNKMKKTNCINEIKTISYSFDNSKINYSYPMLYNYIYNINRNINNIRNNNYNINYAPYKDNIYLYNHLISKSNDDFTLNNNINKYINFNKYKNNNNDFNNNIKINQLKCLKINVPKISKKIENKDNNNKNCTNKNYSFNNNNIFFSNSEKNLRKNGIIQEIIIKRKIITPKKIKYNPKEELNPINSQNSSYNYNNNNIIGKRSPVKINLNIYKEPKFYVSVHQEKILKKEVKNNKLRDSYVAQEKQRKNYIEKKDNKKSKDNNNSLTIKKLIKRGIELNQKIIEKNPKKQNNKKIFLKKENINNNNIKISNKDNNKQIKNSIRYTEKSPFKNIKKENEIRKTYNNIFKKDYSKKFNKSPVNNKNLKNLNKNRKMKEMNDKNEIKKNIKNNNNKKKDNNNIIDKNKDKKYKNIASDKKTFINNSFFNNKVSLLDLKKYNLKKIKIGNSFDKNITNKNTSKVFIYKNKYQNSSNKTQNQINNNFNNNNNTNIETIKKSFIGIQSQKQLKIKNLFINNTTFDDENEKIINRNKPQNLFSKFWTSTSSKRSSLKNSKDNKRKSKLTKRIKGETNEKFNNILNLK